MIHTKGYVLKKLALLCSALFAFSAHAQLHTNIDSVADYAVNTYQQSQIHTLTNFVARVSTLYLP